MATSALFTSDNERNALIPMLQQVQSELGYVSKEAILEIGKQLQVSTSEIFGVLTFYTQFRLKPLGRHTIKVCSGTACHVRGAPLIIEAVTDELILEESEDTTPDGEFTFEKVACFGACSLAPVIIMDDETKGNITPDQARKKVRKIIKDIQTKAEANNE
ncbi:MAG TPA: NAD(P)H-dependent oxidoreductase subunit E [Anaerolineales bacterium]|nr:NAD(P)H-dependent oxidoreductase subunit E [Anaerolineales bacterium]